MSKGIFSLLAFVFTPAMGFAAPQFECTAQVREVFEDGSVRSEKVALAVESETAQYIILSATLDGRAYVFSGDKENGPYFVSITEEPSYTKGSLTTAMFSTDGRLQISVVNGTLVHKLECYKK